MPTGTPIQGRTPLILMFVAILVAMLCVTGWASLTQPLWAWRGPFVAPDHAWTIATLFDAYCGFLTFYAWVWYKERAVGRAAWFVAVMLLGNIAMASYVLRELLRLRPDEPVATLLTRRAA
jgi:hypothetical protein